MTYGTVPLWMISRMEGKGKILKCMLFFGLYRQELEVERIIPHEKYRDGNDYKSDIALIKLKKDLDSTYMPACLAPKLEDYTGKEGSLYGWGATADVFLGKPCSDIYVAAQKSKILCNFIPAFSLILPSSGGAVMF